MSTTAYRMTLAQYATYHAPPGFRDELINGELLLSPSPTRRHQDLCFALLRLLDEKIDSSKFVVRMDTTMILGSDEEEGQRPRPDVFIISKERWIAADEDGGFPKGSPELVIEVRSPSNSDGELLTKKDLYLANGCLSFWVVHAESSMVQVWDCEGSSLAYQASQFIPLPPVISEGTVSVSRIFEGIVA